MPPSQFRISGTGCALVDYLYNPVHFNSPEFLKYLSVKAGNGGLSPGKLVFTEELESFSGEEYTTIRNRLTKGNKPVTLNVGGPSIVSLIHAAQILQNAETEVFFYGCRGRDDGGSFIEDCVAKTPLKIGNYKLVDRYTPFTDVLCDPEYEGGERIFLNNIGAAWEMYPKDLDDDFFNSDITVFGGTALVPHIHSAIDTLLARAKTNGSITVVNTVYDFLSEKNNPAQPWKLGQSNETYSYIDILITDMEEALRLSGADSPQNALDYFRTAGAGAAIITHGANDLHFYSESELFGKVLSGKIPVSAKVKTDLLDNSFKIGDTTGCGDNFAGGVIASIAEQKIKKPHERISLPESIALGVVSGGFTCFYNGGTYVEEFPGQKSGIISEYLQMYRKQIGL